MQPNIREKSNTTAPTFSSRRSTRLDNYSLAGAAQQRGNQLSRKANLLAESTRSFCEFDRPNRHEIEMFKELFYQMIGDCGKAERRLLSASLARNVYTPRQILMYLALDTADIAAPVLLFSPAINEFDIKTLADRLSLDHLKILCRRMDLSEESAKALEKAGGKECAELLARNPALAQSRQPAAAPRPASDLATPETSGLPEPSGLIEKPDIVRSSPSRRNDTENQIVKMAAIGGKLGRNQPSDHASFQYDPKLPLEAQLLQVTRKGRKEGLAELVESYCGIRASIVRRLLDEPDAENLCVLFKGLGAGFVVSLQLLLLLNSRIASSRTCYDNIKTIINEIDFVECRRFLEKLGGKFDEQEADTGKTSSSNNLMGAVASRRREISERLSVTSSPEEEPQMYKETG